MLGTLRLLLALMVVVGHLYWLTDIGRHAVFGFYALSGYLMTMVMHDSYGYSKAGIIKFAANRALRLYPAYWLACLFSLAIIYFYGQAAVSEYNLELFLPSTALEVFANVTMVFPAILPSKFEPRLSPATWALTVEMFYYLLIALGISATKKRTLLWIGASLVYVVFTYAADMFWHARYHAIPAGSLPFSLGALLYFLHKDNWQPRWLQSPWLSPKVLFAVLVINAMIASVIQTDESRMLLVEAFFYANVLISVALIYSLIRGNTLLPISRSTDKQLGDFSYPIYLIHWQVGIIVASIVLGRVDSMKHQFLPLSWLLTTTLLVLFSLLLIKLVDKPIEKLRERLRGKQAY
jgi:peptidoglycan/LPS O-acetylase OafA/YrhL